MKFHFHLLQKKLQINICAPLIYLGENAVLHYIIPSGIADGKFAISSFTGEITTSATLNREFRENWVITGKLLKTLMKISKGNIKRCRCTVFG